MSFKDWLTGDKVTNTGIEYSPIYWITLSVVLLILILLIVFSALKKIPNKIKQNVLIGIAIFQLAFEVVWRIIFAVFKGSTFVNLWPMYPCNLGGIIVPIVCLLNSKKRKRFILSFRICWCFIIFCTSRKYV